MIATTLEQSRKLVELGINPNTADMCYKMFAENDSDWQYGLIPCCPLDLDIPAWSLSALIDLLPSTIKDNELWFGYNLYISKNCIFYASYEENEHPNILYGIELFNRYTGENKGINSFIDAAFEMICWLKENKYI